MNHLILVTESPFSSSLRLSLHYSFFLDEFSQHRTNTNPAVPFAVPATIFPAGISLKWVPFPCPIM